MSPEQSCDVIVVGTGPGGATVARDLVRAGKKVLLLERGPPAPRGGRFLEYAARQLVPGRSLLVTPELVAVVRGLTVGGSSTFYYATAFPAPLGMLQRRGIELAPDVEQVRAELRVGPLPDRMMTPMATRLLDAARSLGLPWSRLDKFIDPRAWGPGMRFGFYGDVSGAIWSARAFVREAVEGGATLVTGARVERVLVEGDVATGVEYVQGRDRRRVSASAVVLAAGGIGSPLLLRATGIAEAGADFFFDPLVTVAGTVRGVRLQAGEIPLSAGLVNADEGFMLADMPVPRAVHLIFTAQVMKLRRLFAFRDTARIMVKIRDGLSGRLSSRGGVRKRLTRGDREKLDAGVRAARRILAAAGATDLYRTGIFGAHPGGTAKLGEVVDANLETRIRRLFVCDCSVIPEPWGLPPTLTIVALARRLARQLVTRSEAQDERAVRASGGAAARAQ